MAAPQMNSLCGSDVYRINELVRAVKEWRKATALKSASAFRLWKTLGACGKAKDDLCNRREKAHCGSMSFVGWSVAASGASRRKETADWVMWSERRRRL